MKINNEKKPNLDSFWTPFAPKFGGGSSADSPLKIWDVLPPYLKTLLTKKKN